MTIPNQLTLLRILLTPIFVLVFYMPFAWANVVACLVFIIAALTDLLDGYLARKLGQTSSLGTFLDPVADKLMVAVILVFLVQQNPSIYLALPAAVIIGREIAVSALREWMAEVGVRSKIAVSVWGQVKTVTQMVALGFLIFEEPVFGMPVYAIGMVLLYVATTLTLISMCQYLLIAWPQLKE